MPKLRTEQIAELIAAGGVGAITLDTNVVDGPKLNLNSPLFSSLAQFKGTGVKFILPEVVSGEIKAHISQRAISAAIKARAAIRELAQARFNPGLRENAEAIIDVDADASAIAQAEVQKFLNKIGGELLDLAGKVSTPQLLDMYFQARAPFAAGEKKKSEFPDAIALLTLEEWASAEGTIVMAVSRDSGWKAYAANSKGVLCVDNLREVYALFNSEDTIFAKRFVNRLNDGQHAELMIAIEQAAQSFIEDAYPEFDFSSNYIADVQYTGVTFNGIDAIDVDEVAASPGDDGSVGIIMEVIVNASFEAEFTFSVKDEGDYVPIGSTYVEREQAVTIYVAITITRDDEKPDLLDIEADRPRTVFVDFGSVEPDWGEPDIPEDFWDGPDPQVDESGPAAPDGHAGEANR